MSSNRNSIAALTGGSLPDAFEALGITQFPDAAGWYQVIGGLIVQGGSVDIAGAATATINLHAPYEKQLLGIWTQIVGGAGNNAYVTAADLDSFQIVNGAGDRTYYWLSLGV
jgi:hypothetical protein